MKKKLLVVATCLLGLLSTLGTSLPYPILPPLFADGATSTLNGFMGWPPKLLLGLALAINPLGLMLGAAVLGPLSDRYGRRPVLLVTAIGAAVGHVLTAWSLLLGSFPLFLIARLVTGVLEGNASVARALLADQLFGNERGLALAWLNGALFLGWAGGPLLAGATLSLGITIPFWIAAVALLLSAASIAIGLKSQEIAASSTSWWHVARDRHALHLLRMPALRAVFLTQLAYSCGTAAFYEFFPLWLVETAHADTKLISWITGALCVTLTIASVVAGRARNVSINLKHLG